MNTSWRRSDGSSMPDDCSALVIADPEMPRISCRASAVPDGGLAASLTSFHIPGHSGPALAARLRDLRGSPIGSSEIHRHRNLVHCLALAFPFTWTARRYTVTCQQLQMASELACRRSANANTPAWDGPRSPGKPRGSMPTYGGAGPHAARGQGFHLLSGWMCNAMAL